MECFGHCKHSHKGDKTGYPNLRKINNKMTLLVGKADVK